MWIVWKVSVDHNQVSSGNKFIGVYYRPSIDFKNGRSRKAIGTIIFC